MLDSEIIDRIDKRFDELNNKLDKILRDNTKTVGLQAKETANNLLRIEKLKTEVKIYGILTAIGISSVLGLHFGLP